jgi:hypothetical protein
VTGRDREAEDNVRVVVPDEAPMLALGAARVLLRIVRDAQASHEELRRSAA